MARYIDADAFIKYCDKNWIPLNVDAVNKQPTADVVARKRAKWLLKKVCDDEYGVEKFIYTCSECGSSAYEFLQPYCQRCGAEMERREQ